MSRMRRATSGSAASGDTFASLHLAVVAAGARDVYGTAEHNQILAARAAEAANGLDTVVTNHQQARRVVGNVGPTHTWIDSVCKIVEPNRRASSMATLTLANFDFA